MYQLLKIPSSSKTEVAAANNGFRVEVLPPCSRCGVVVQSGEGGAASEVDCGADHGTGDGGKGIEGGSDKQDVIMMLLTRLDKAET